MGTGIRFENDFFLFLGGQDRRLSKYVENSINQD